MSSRNASPALDLIFPPEECVWQTEAENYVKYGTLTGEPMHWMGMVVPYFAMEGLLGGPS
jgi:hypothetical protein